MRPAGSGTVTPLKNPDGSIRGYWARLPRSESQRSVGVFPTEEEASRALDAATVHAAKSPYKDDSFAAFAKRVLEMREEDGLRSVESEKDRFRLHLEKCALASKSVKEIQPVDIADLVRALGRKNKTGAKGKLSKKTVARCLSLVSSVFTVAIERGMRPDNPCAGIRVRTADASAHSDEESEQEGWDYLRKHEQELIAASDKIPEWAKLNILIAIGLGWRQGEHWNCELRDIHLDAERPYVFVRWGSKGKAPKNGKRRKVPILPWVRPVLRRWLEVLPTYAPENPLGLLFPTKTGARRQNGAPEKSVRMWDKAKDKVMVRKEELFPQWLASVGIKRRIRWHDLRHTCGTSLVNGWWGRRWALEEVRDFLGHSSVTVTEKYAHVDKTELLDAAEETSYKRVTGGFSEPAHAAISQEESDTSGPIAQSVELRTFNPRRSRGVSKGYTPETPSGNSDITRITLALIQAVGEVDPAKAFALAKLLA